MATNLIEDADSVFGRAFAHANLPLARMAEHGIHFAWHRTDKPKVVPVGVYVGAKAYAFVNESRWIVRCPGCHGAALASKTDRRTLCMDCLNSSFAGSWLAVEWPASVTQIEDLLSRRPSPLNRNWVVGEPVADLIAENERERVR